MIARRLTAWALAALVASTGAAAAADRAAPQRIVSINLCTDQLALLLAPERLLSVSFLAADPASSAMAERARGYPLNRGRAEEILPFRPDIVLAGTYGARATSDLLRRLGHRVWELPIGRDLPDVARDIRALARVLGVEARGEALIADFDRRMAAIAPPPAGPRPLAALYSPNGITAGASSLPHAVMAAAGFDNLAARRGVAGVGRVDVEAIALAKPDLLILGRLRGDRPSLAAATLAHPALTGHRAPHAVVGLPHHLWACAIPQIVEAVEDLARARARLAAKGTAR